MGIRRALIKEIVQRAKLLKVRELMGGAVQGAEGFYMKMGFKPYLFVQVWEDKIPKNYRELGFRISRISRRGGTIGLMIPVKKVLSEEKDKAKKIFDAYSVIYLFVRNFH